MATTIVPVTAENVDHLVHLVIALAEYERLPPPDEDAIVRLQHDLCAERPRLSGVLAFANGTPVGYALYFNTYSSFLAKPTMYLEDLFVEPSAREHGVGQALFEHVRDTAKEQGCGRVEWQVLDWNTLARTFYDRRGGQAMTQWIPYRIDLTTTEEPE